MIKQLIEDITFEKITLNQALTRAKIIAYKINNTQFKEWINSEINGYVSNENLPAYRIISCDVFAEAYHPFRGKYIVPFDVSNLEKDLKNDMSFYKMYMRQSISLLEENICHSAGHEFGYENLPMGMVNTLKSFAGSDGDNITGVMRRLNLGEVKYIVETTRQKLLDTLLELNDAFPNFENEYKNDTHNSQKTQNIITQNIYGNNTNTNLGVGDHITQTIENHNKIDEFINEIRKLGVNEEDVKDIKELLSETNKQNLGKKMMNWAGKIATKAVETGVELQMPKLLKLISDFF